MFGPYVFHLKKKKKSDLAPVKMTTMFFLVEFITDFKTKNHVNIKPGLLQNYLAHIHRHVRIGKYGIQTYSSARFRFTWVLLSLPAPRETSFL